MSADHKSMFTNVRQSIRVILLAHVVKFEDCGMVSEIHVQQTRQLIIYQNSDIMLALSSILAG